MRNIDGHRTHLTQKKEKEERGRGRRMRRENGKDKRLRREERKEGRKGGWKEGKKREEAV